uniref:Uncharacterized protein n=1 Tax=Salmonella enterica subsp. salamae TaxID=59202 RepID=I3W425_SALER|nr:hypothetical protein [Salmonella enterica subsp. salamae]
MSAFRYSGATPGQAALFFGFYSVFISGFVKKMATRYTIGSTRSVYA